MKRNLQNGSSRNERFVKTTCSQAGKTEKPRIEAVWNDTFEFSRRRSTTTIEKYAA